MAVLMIFLCRAINTISSENGYGRVYVQGCIGQGKGKVKHLVILQLPPPVPVQTPGNGK